ncbi:MAG: glycosyltransferase family 39 protein [Bacteroidota bacterium]
MKIKIEHILLSLILLVAAFLRFYQYGSWSLSNDELSALARLQYGNFNDLIREGVMLIDFHPAGVQVFLWYWTKLFGFDVWVVRLPFVIFGVLSVYMIFLVGKQWFNEKVGLLAAATFAVLQYPVLYGQLARPYSPGLLFVLLTAWYWTKIIIKEKKTFIHYAGFALFTALAAYTHHYSFLFVLVMGATGLLFVRRNEIIKYLLACLAVGLLYLPHLHVFLYQFDIGGVGGEDGWLGEPGKTWIWGYLKYAFNDSWASVLLVVAIGLSGFIINPLKRLNRFHYIAFSWFMLSFLIGYYYSIFRNPILQYSILLFAFPFLILFLFSFFSDRSYRHAVILVPVILLLGFIQIFFVNNFYKQQHFGEFEDVAINIAAWHNEFGSENITSTIVVNHPYYIHYYLDAVMPGISFSQYDNKGREDLLELTKIVDESTTPYFIYAWTKPAPWAVEDIIMHKYPCKVSEMNYSGLSAVTLYTVGLADTCNQLSDPVAAYYDDFEKAPLAGNSLALDTMMSANGNTSYHHSPAEFEYSLVYKAHEINDAKFDQIRASLLVYCDSVPTAAFLVISVESPAKDVYYWRAAKFEYFAEPFQWSRVSLNGSVPEIKSKDDVVKVYIWNSNKESFNIDDFELAFYLR